MRMKLNINYFIATSVLLLIEISIALFLDEGFIRFTVGDYLASILLYCIIKSFFKLKPLIIVLITLFISYGIEWLQYINILQLLNIENNTLIKTVLGTSFSVGDLIAYTLGCITIYIIDLKTSRTCTL